MATRSFLLDSEADEALQRLTTGSRFPDNVRSSREAFCLWLETKLLDRLNALGNFSRLEPVLLGSWSRHELTPKSDIDLLFAGPESETKEFISRAFKAGLKLRARTPENLEDWTVGVEPFDILALNSAKALNPATEVR